MNMKSWEKRGGNSRREKRPPKTVISPPPPPEKGKKLTKPERKVEHGGKAAAQREGRLSPGRRGAKLFVGARDQEKKPNQRKLRLRKTIKKGKRKLPQCGTGLTPRLEDKRGV